jgi:hypothetical protein
MGNCNEKSKNSELEDNYAPNPSQTDLRVIFKESTHHERDLSMKTSGGSSKLGSISSLNEESEVEIQLNNGARYKGFVRNGSAHGQGVYSSTQHEYDGHWLDGKPHGHGKLIYKFKNAVYEGEFSHGIMQGRGTYILGSDTENPDFSYKGEMMSGRYEGFGEARWKGGAEYSGSFQKGLYHGQGHFKWSDGKIFAGNYAGGVKEGRGKVITKDAVFTGTWTGGKPVGEGEISMSEALVKGAWTNGRFVAHHGKM